MAFEDDYAVLNYATSTSGSKFSLEERLTFGVGADKDLCRVLNQTLNIEKRRRPSSANLHQQIAGKLWRSIGDDLQECKLYNNAITAYDKGISETGVKLDPINGPLVEGMSKAREAASGAKVYPVRMIH
jgi:hypothetical protein